MDVIMQKKLDEEMLAIQKSKLSSFAQAYQINTKLTMPNYNKDSAEYLRTRNSGMNGIQEIYPFKKPLHYSSHLSKLPWNMPVVTNTSSKFSNGGTSAGPTLQYTVSPQQMKSDTESIKGTNFETLLSKHRLNHTITYHFNPGTYDLTGCGSAEKLTKRRQLLFASPPNQFPSVTLNKISQAVDINQIFADESMYKPTGASQYKKPRFGDKRECLCARVLKEIVEAKMPTRQHYSYCVNNPSLIQRIRARLTEIIAEVEDSKSYARKMAAKSVIRRLTSKTYVETLDEQMSVDTKASERVSQFSFNKTKDLTNQEITSKQIGEPTMTEICDSTEVKNIEFKSDIDTEVDSKTINKFTLPLSENKQDSIQIETMYKRAKTLLDGKIIKTAKHTPVPVVPPEAQSKQKKHSFFKSSSPRSTSEFTSPVNTAIVTKLPENLHKRALPKNFILCMVEELFDLPEPKNAFSKSASLDSNAVSEFKRTKTNTSSPWSASSH